VVIGTVAGLLMIASVSFVENKLKVDDPVGAVSVHGANGLWGLLAVGIFSDGSYGGVAGLVAGNGSQILAQLVAMAVVIVWALGTGLLMFALIKRGMGLRASAEEEREGLDISEHGVEAYPMDAVVV
jgi:Amt family ammonium transporter